MLQSIFDIQSAGVTKQKRTLFPEFLSTRLLFNFDFDIEFIDSISIILFRALDKCTPSKSSWKMKRMFNVYGNISTVKVGKKGKKPALICFRCTAPLHVGSSRNINLYNFAHGINSIRYLAFLGKLFSNWDRSVLVGLGGRVGMCIELCCIAAAWNLHLHLHYMRLRVKILVSSQNYLSIQILDEKLAGT